LEVLDQKEKKMALDAASKQQMVDIEMGSFYGVTATAKAFTNESSRYGGQFYRIYRDCGDKDAGAKAAAAHAAVKAIKDTGMTIPSDLRIYCIGDNNAQNRAFHRGQGWVKIAFVVLGGKAVVGGRADAVSATRLGGYAIPAISCIHEIGHCLHETSAGDDLYFGTGSILTGAPVNATQVSGYAAMTKKEFVAEVFASLILGRTFNQAVMDEYRLYQGPVVP